jgi:hypothetical protein
MTSANPLKKVQPGDDLPGAQTFNYFIDTAIAEKNRSINTGGQPLQDFRQTGIVKVLNASGSTVSRNGVLGVSGVIITQTNHENEFLRQVALTGTTPARASHHGLFVVLIDPLESGKIGRGVISGAVPVQVDILDTGHLFADIKDGDGTQLESQAIGSARILYREPPIGTDPATGTHWCVVLLGVTNPYEVFPVTVAKDGGEAGSPAVGTIPGENCSFTYTVYDYAGQKIEDTVSPEHARHPETIYLEAGADGRSDKGLAYWDVSSAPLGTEDYGQPGALILIHLPGEIESSDEC